jgi:Protein of unknown function (DUF3592)
MGLGAFLGTIGSVWKTRQARSWPVANGIITHSRLYVDPDRSEGGTRAEIAYSFVVGGRQFESKQVTLAPTYQSDAYKASLLARFPLGSAVPVRYNPSNCKQSVLCTDISPVWPLGMLVGLAFAVSGILAP